MNARAQQLLDTRYGTDALPAPAAWTPVIDHLLGHRSVRHHLPDAVGDDQLSAIIAAAQSAATSSNLQAWSVVAARNPDTRAALAECAGGQDHVAKAPLVLVWLADLARLAHVAESVGRPHGALDYLEMFVIGVVDAALAAQNALAAAESLGLSGCYIGGLRNQPERVAELLGLPPRVFAVFGMTLGKEDPAAPPATVKPRLPQKVVLHQERYLPVDRQQAGIDAYNAAMARFYEAQQMNVHGTWAVHSSKRIAGPETLSGRDRLTDALRGMGFALK
jgi:nitroreductase